MSKKLYAKVKDAFIEHPKSAGETYWQHLRFTVCVAARLQRMSVTAVLHGLLPFVCVRTTSQEAEKLYGAMKCRLEKTDEVK